MGQAPYCSITRRLIAPVVIILAVLVASTGATAETLPALRLPAVFGDHMVLQRDMPAPMWGWAAPGATVRVRVSDVVKTAQADAEGRWRLELDSLPAGGPLAISIAAGGEAITLTDVLVGEVWICSGQSNMFWPLERTDNAAAEIASADHPRLRLFAVAQDRSPREVRNDCQGQWRVCTPDVARRFSAVAYYFGRNLMDELNVPVGLIHASWGGTPVESWISRPALAATEAGQGTLAQWEQWAAEWDEPTAMARHERRLAEWETARAKAEAEGAEAPRRPRQPVDPLQNQWFPSTLYNAMIAPVAPYGLRGAIWYQGESNAGRPEAYREVFPAMIRDWRRAWGKPDMPFYFVQLANFVTTSNWAYIREAQAAALDLPHTGMAVAIDIGDPTDIHPGNKREVGRRLTLWALAKIHGHDVVYSGPLYRSMEREGRAIRLRFDHAEGGLIAKDGPPATFEIAGEDRVFHPATARIDGTTVVVAADRVVAPVAVRYAWASNPAGCNLYNAAGLPAAPFRTDPWPRDEH